MCKFHPHIDTLILTRACHSWSDPSPFSNTHRPEEPIYIVPICTAVSQLSAEWEDTDSCRAVMSSVRDHGWVPTFPCNGKGTYSLSINMLAPIACIVMKIIILCAKLLLWHYILIKIILHYFKSFRLFFNVILSYFCIVSSGTCHVQSLSREMHN